MDVSYIQLGRFFMVNLRYFNKKLCTDYLFTAGLKGFRIELNKIIDPMIPISYDSKVWITPSGTLNLYEETMECLLVEIQDNG